MVQGKELFHILKEIAIQCGKISLPYYGKISSTQKHMHLDGKLHASPVTAIDLGLQEMILAELIRNGYAGKIGFNGEEETPLRFFFPLQRENGITLHCDPIDGTASFSRGDNRYSVGMGLSRHTAQGHDFFATIVYQPLSNELMWAFDGEISHPQKSRPPLTVYAYHVFTEKGLQKLSSMGYQLGNAGNAHAGILDIALGKAAAFLIRTTEVHDACVPLAFARNLGIDIWLNGKYEKGSIHLKSNGKNFERLNKVAYFANEEIAQDLIPIFEDPLCVRGSIPSK